MDHKDEGRETGNCITVLFATVTVSHKKCLIIAKRYCDCVNFKREETAYPRKAINIIRDVDPKLKFYSYLISAPDYSSATLPPGKMLPAPIG